MRPSLPRLLTFALLGVGPYAFAATTLSDSPLSSATSGDVKPNVMFVLDDSGSMDWMFMPDELQDDNSPSSSDTIPSQVGVRNSSCNTVYYNPAITYLPPRKADGSRMPDRPFNAACDDGYDTTASCTVNLNNNFKHMSRYRSYDPNAQGGYYYEYSGTQTLTPLSAACTTPLGVPKNSNGQPTYLPDTVSATGGGTWTRVLVTSQSAAEQTNFANWYSYYRKRIMMMKASVGEAFSGISDKYRIGFLTISPMTGSPATIDSAQFLAPKPFKDSAVSPVTTQRTDWYKKLYAADPNGGTPLREALSRVGRYYAGYNDGINKGMIPAQADDPVQYSCQQNFTILTTDGYWNGNAGVQLDGTTTMGNYDNNYSAKDINGELPISQRPMFDGSGQVNTTTDKLNQYQLNNCTISQDRYRILQWQQAGVTSRTGDIQKRTNTLQRSTSTLQTRTNQLQERTSTLQKRVDQLQKRTQKLQTRNSTNSGSSWSGWSDVATCTWDTSGSTRRDCRYDPSASWVSASTCTVVAGSTGSGNGTTWSVPEAISCQYQTGTTSNTSTCTPQAPSTAPNYTVQNPTVCQYTTWSGWSNATSCTTAPQSSGSGTWSVATARECNTVTSSWANASSACTASSSPGFSRECQYTAWTSPVGVSSCSAAPQSSGPTYSTLTAVACSRTDPAWASVSSGQTCSATSPASNGTYTECQTVWGAWGAYTGGSTCTAKTTQPARECGNDGFVTATGPCVQTSTKLCQSTVDTDWTNIASCAPVAPSVANGGKETVCSYGTGTAPGFNVQYRTKTTTTSQLYSGTTAIGSPTTTVSGWSSWATMPAPLGTCTATEPTVPVEGRPVSPTPPLPTGGCSAWPCVALGSTSGGASGTLADVAQYYYINDLRPTNGAKKIGALGADVTANNVPRADATNLESDLGNWQHMTTFTLGLGLSGTRAYDKNYKNGAGDFASIRSGALEWPAPSADDPTALDDLWHAAVNGRGQYFSANNPTSVAASLNEALSGINARVASAAAAATSNLEPVSGDNFAFTAKYVTSKWTGDLEAKEINLTTGKISDTVLWSVAGQLDGKVGAFCDNRKIKLFRSGATKNMVDFKWNTYACDGSGNQTGSAVTTLNATEQASFGSAQIASLGQYPTMTDGTSGTVNQRALAPNSTLLNYLRGQNGHEGYETNTTKYFRARDHVLGDIVNAQPVFVKKPFANYLDSGYSGFKNSSTRPPMVYIAANDGMLHAIHASDPDASLGQSGWTAGEEAWAFMPSSSLANLYRLADTDYNVNHVYTVDGTPTVADIFDGSNWRTILVAGLNKGGKLYYALDITDPTNPIALWQFAPASMGYSYGNPVIGKLKSGKWAVILTSGVNDATGRLYVLDPVTGNEITTKTGEASCVSPFATGSTNLMKIVGWTSTDPIFDNTVDHLYGADLNGNVWRFDINDVVGDAGCEVTLLTTVKDSGGNPQPITTKPEVALVGTGIYVYVATGKFLGADDLTSTQTQSVYGIRDPMTTPSSGPVIAGRSVLAKQEFSQTGSSEDLSTKRTIGTCQPAPDGWYADLTDSGERVNTDMKLQLGSLIVGSNVPRPGACNVGGYSWLNYFNTSNGCAINKANPIVSERLSDSLVVGLNVVRLPSGKTVVIATTSDAANTTLEPPFNVADPRGRRLTWREITPD